MSLLTLNHRNSLQNVRRVVTLIFSGLFLLLMFNFVKTPHLLAQTRMPTDAIQDVQNYIVYYGVGGLETLMEYDLAIIQPETLSADDLATLKENGTLVVAYLSLGEAETYRPWFDRVEEDWILGENPNWGSLFIDVRESGWQQIMVEQTGLYLEMGFDGVFLDTVDTVDAFPETRLGMETLIGELRSVYPDALLIQNRGFTVLPTTKAYIDALMFEGLVTGYNFQTDMYTQITVNTALVESLQEVQDETRLVVLALDYADACDTETPLVSQAAAEQYGFISAMAEISLQTLPDDAVCPLPGVVDPGQPPTIIFAATDGGCPLFNGMVTWQDLDGNVAGIIVGWGADAEPDYAQNYSVESDATAGQWHDQLQLVCSNASGGGCYVKFQVIDAAGNLSETSEVYHSCP